MIGEDGTEHRMVESLSLIDAVMPDIVATRQNQINQQKQQVKTEGQDTNGEEGNLVHYMCIMIEVEYCFFYTREDVTKLEIKLAIKIIWEIMHIVVSLIHPGLEKLNIFQTSIEFR